MCRGLGKGWTCSFRAEVTSMEKVLICEHLASSQLQADLFPGPVERGQGHSIWMDTNTAVEQILGEKKSLFRVFFHIQSSATQGFNFQTKKSEVWAGRMHTQSHTKLCTLLMTRIMPCLSSNVSREIKAVQVMAKAKDMKAWWPHLSRPQMSSPATPGPWHSGQCRHHTAERL